MKALLHGPFVILVVQALLIIALSRLVGLGARRMRQPMVIAEIVAGIALGPSLFGWALPGISGDVFPAQSLPLLSQLSQVGLILFMFLVGLEFDPKLLRGRGHTSVFISHTSIIVPFALGALIAPYLYRQTSDPRVAFSSFTLFMGAAMSITAFPVLARILTERRLLHTKVGAVTITCAAVDDVTAWCVLAFVVAIAKVTGIAGAIQTTILAVGYIALMLLAVRPFVGRLSQRSLNKEGVSQNLVAVMMLLLLLSSITTELIGIHALFGAFVMGAIVPKENAFARVLAEKIEDLVVVLFLPLFFAYSGLRTHIGLLGSASDWALCGLVILVACVGKFGGSAIAARLTGIGWRESSALGILMNTRGLMELVVLNIGLDLGVISPKLFTMMVLMALVTTFMTSPLLEWIYPLSELSKELVEPPAEPEPEPEGAFTVLACVSFDATGPALATLGAALVGDGNGSGRMYALRLLPPADRASFVLEQQSEPEAATALAPLVERASALGLNVKQLSFVSAQPARDICSVAEVKHADIVLLGWHKPLIGNAMLGGVVHQVMQHAASDVGVLVDRGLSRIERVLVPYLGSDHDKAALRLSRLVAENTGASVCVLHVARKTSPERIGVEQKVAEVFEEHTARGVIKVEFKLVEHDDPAEAAIEESAGGYDLVIVGVGPVWGLQHRPFGIQSERIIASSTASLLIVRQRELAVEAGAMEPLASAPAASMGG